MPPSRGLRGVWGIGIKDLGEVLVQNPAIKAMAQRFQEGSSGHVQTLRNIHDLWKPGNLHLTHMVGMLKIRVHVTL